MSSSRHILAVNNNIRRMFSTKTIGFIGLGNMGNRMAKNLAKNGYNLVVSDLSAAATSDCAAFAQSLNRSCIVASTPLDVAKHADIVVTMLPSAAHVRSIAGQMLPSMKKGALFIDSSTIDPQSTQEVAKLAASHGVTMVDAPVSGGIKGAEEATLTFMVGGTPDNFTEVSPILKCMGKNIVHCGEVGLGQVAKICNNLMLGISMVGVSEAYNLGIKLGMNPEKLANIFNTSSARCWSSDTYNPVPGVMPNVPSSKGYAGGFQVALMKKDLDLANQAATSSNQPLLMGNQARQVYQELIDNGKGTTDFSVVYQLFKEKDSKK